MRTKHIFAKIPVPSTVIKLIWTRLTLNRTITLYVLISFLLALSQIPLQVATHDVNANARKLLEKLLETAQIPILDLVPVLVSDPLPNSNVTGSRLEVCEAASADEELDDCVIVWADGGILQADGTYGEGTDSDSDDEDDGEDDEDDEEDDDDDNNRRGKNRTRRAVRVRRTPHRPHFSPLAAFNAGSIIRRVIAFDNASIKRSKSVSLQKRDAIVATPLFDTGITSNGRKKPSPNDPPVEETDAEEMTPVVGLRITDPAQDGSLMMISDSRDAFAKGVFGVVKVADREAAPKGGNTTVAVNIINGPTALQQASVPRACALSLLYPTRVLYDAEREDIALVGFHLWLLALHVVGILNESVLYVLLSIGGLFVAVCWSIGVIVRTTHFRQDFERLIARGACGGVDVLPNWFKQRIALEIPILVISLLAFIVLAYLSRTLVRVYVWNTNRRLNARWAISKMYRTLLLFSASLQIGAFFVAMTIILWLDQLSGAAVVAHSSHKSIYQGTAIPVLVLTIFWLILGWMSIRREHKHLTHLFLGITALFLFYFGAMLTRASWRFTVEEWPFFAFLSSASMLCTLLVLVFGIWCRINFGKGLKEALNEMALKEDADETVWDFRHLADDKEAHARLSGLDEKSDAISGITYTRSMNTVSQPTTTRAVSPDLVTVPPPPPTWMPESDRNTKKSTKRVPVPSIAKRIDPFVFPAAAAAPAIAEMEPLAVPPAASLPASRSPSPVGSGRKVGLPSSVRPTKV